MPPSDVSGTPLSDSADSVCGIGTEPTRLRGGAFSEKPDSTRSKTEAASDTTKRPTTEAASHSTKSPAARSTTFKSSSETYTSPPPEAVAAPVVIECLPTNSANTSVSKITTVVSRPAESYASMVGLWEAKRESVKPMIETAIKVGKYYGLNLKEGIPNLANGDCAIETTLDQLDKRPEFEGHRVPGEPQFYREKWFSEIECVASRLMICLC